MRNITGIADDLLESALRIQYLSPANLSCITVIIYADRRNLRERKQCRMATRSTVAYFRVVPTVSSFGRERIGRKGFATRSNVPNRLTLAVPGFKL